MVRGIDRRLKLEIQLDSDWSFKLPSGDWQNLVPAEYADRSQLAVAHMKVAQRQADADLALWWGPEDKGAFGGYDFNWLVALDPATYTEADYLVRQREVETLTATLPGAELRDIHKRWIAKQELLTWPPLDARVIEDAKSCRIVIPMDLIQKHGTRRKTLNDVGVGPMVMPSDVAGEIFSHP